MWYVWFVRRNEIGFNRYWATNELTPWHRWSHYKIKSIVNYIVLVLFRGAQQAVYKKSKVKSWSIPLCFQRERKKKRATYGQYSPPSSSQFYKRKKNQKAKKEHTKSHAHNYYPFYELIVFHYSSSKNIKRRVTWIGDREREIR